MNLDFFKKHFFISGWLETWRPYFLLLVIIFLVYGSSLFFDLTFLDDNVLILDNQEILTDVRNLPSIFTTDAFFSENRLYYRPMLNVSLMLDSIIAPLNYVVYHFSNILWHFLAVILSFALLSRLFKRPQLAFLLAIIMAVHPALSQAVAWIPGRNDSLVTVFSLLSFWFFLNFLDKEKLSNFLSLSAFFFLALLSKETVVFLPLLFIVYFFIFNYDWKTKGRSLLLSLLGSGTVMFIWFLLRDVALGGGKIDSSNAFYSVLQNIIPSGAMMAKIFLPFNLSVLPVVLDTSYVYILIILPILILLFIFSKHKDWRYIIFGLFWFSIFFFPPFVIAADAPFLLEHRLYLPYIGLAIAVCGFSGARSFSWAKKRHFLLALMIIVLFSSISFFHIASFSNRLTFWESAVESSPHSPLAQKNLGAMYYLDGNLDKAEIYFKQSLELNPNESMIHNNLAAIYIDRNDLQSAELELNKELDLYPNYDIALFNLGRIYYQKKEYEEAAVFWQRALQSNPLNYQAYASLKKLQIEQKQ